jgi:hypothetical protein
MINNTWIWLRGTNTPLSQGNYTQLGVLDPVGTPGGRHQMCGWFDYDSREFWIYGGQGRGNGSSEGWMSDLWKFNIASNSWALMSGTGVVNLFPIRGSPMDSSTAYSPGGRRLCAAWWDAQTKQGFIYGGYTPSRAFF